MAIIIKSHKDTLLIDSTIGINYNSGNVLQGEKDMYERIVRDCEASPLTWYMWYDKTFNIPYGGQYEIREIRKSCLEVCHRLLSTFRQQRGHGY